MAKINWSTINRIHVIAALEHQRKGLDQYGYRDAKHWVVLDPRDGAWRPAKATLGIAYLKANGHHPDTRSGTRDRYRGSGKLFKRIFPKLGIELVDTRETPELSEYLDSDDYEGAQLLKVHLTRERRGSVVAKAKAHWTKINPSLPCECCKVELNAIYGDRAKGFIEAHHRLPLSDLDPKDKRKTTIEDLAAVCPNCHRMLHLKPNMTVTELRSLMQTVSDKNLSRKTNSD